MKMVKQIVMMVFAALMAQCVWAEAPVPVVVFNGDLINGAHKNGKYAVTADASQNVTIANGFATTTKVQGTGGYDSHGIQISWDAENTPGTQMTVLVKYSGYAKDGGRTSIFSTLWGDHNTTFSQTWDNKFQATYDVSNADADPADAKTRTNNDATPIPASGVLMFGLCSDDSDANIRGARVAFQEVVEGETKLVEKFRWDGLRWRGAKFGNFYIAGTLGRRNRYYRPAMTVEAVAIFNKTLTVAEANAYVFPTLHRITDVSGTKTLAELLGETTIANGDDVALVMTGNTTLTLPEDVTIGQIGAYGTGELTVANLNASVTGTASINAQSIVGETFTKEGTNTLFLQNGESNGSSETYTHLAINGTAINIVDGKVELNNGHNGDANFNNPTFNIGAYGELDCYGWIRSKGTMTIENATDKTVLTNRGGNSGNLADVPNIVKKGAGKLTMTCNLNSGNATSSTIDIQAGTLCLKNTNDKTLNGAITGAGNLEIDVGAGKSVKLGSANNTMSSIIVTSGALDVAGQKPTSGYTIVANGGTIKSSGSNIYANETSIKSLTLNADTSLTDNKRFGLTTSSGDATSLVLDGHTLTVASGTTSECINFRNTTVTGDGTIAVGANSFMLVYDNGSGSMVAEDAKVTMTATSKLELNTDGTLTVKDFEAADGASIVEGNDRQGTLKVLGTYNNSNPISKLTLGDGAEVSGSATVTTTATAEGTVTLKDGATLTVPTAFTAGTVVSGVVTKRVVKTTVAGGIKYSLETIQPEPPTPTEGGITPSIPGAETIEITVATGPGEETVTGNTIPLTTGVYTVKGKVGDTVVGTQNIGVVAAKAAASDCVTTAVAVPFKGKTVETLLNTALLNKDDTLMAWVDGAYATWTLNADKVWVGQNVLNGAEAKPATTALKCGQAVWVTTAGKIVTFGDTAAQGADVEITTGHNLLGSIAYTDATPTVAATEDQVQLIGEVDADGNEIITRYNKTSTGWESKIQKRTYIEAAKKWVTTEETSDEAPTVKPGRGYWLIRK